MTARRPVWTTVAAVLLMPALAHAAPTGPPSPVPDAGISDGGSTEAAHAGQATAAEGSWHTEAEAGVQYETLSNGYGPWRDGFLTISRSGTQHRAWFASMRDTTRFALRDQIVGGGVAHPFWKGATASAALELSPSHQVAASWSLAGRVDAPLGGGWVANAGVQHRHYDIASVDLVTAGAERYFTAYRAAYSAYVAHLGGGGTAVSHAAQLDRYYGREQGSMIRVILSAGDELERIGPAAILRTSVRAVSLSGRHWVSSRWAVVYAAGVHEQGPLYTRRGVTAGLRVRF
jgi:YaiO family outer membrane protein